MRRIAVILLGFQPGRVHILRFPPTAAEAVRVCFTAFEAPLSIAEVGVYAPRNP